MPPNTRILIPGNEGCRRTLQTQTIGSALVTRANAVIKVLAILFESKFDGAQLERTRLVHGIVA